MELSRGSASGGFGQRPNIEDAQQGDVSNADRGTEPDQGRPASEGALTLYIFNHCLKFFLSDDRHAKLLGGLVLGGIGGIIVIYQVVRL